MEQQTFADGIGRIAIIDGIVRLDLVAHSPTEAGADGKPRAVFTHRIVMGVDQFLRAAEKIAETTRVIRSNTAPQGASAAAPAAAPAAATQPPRQAAPVNQPQTVPPQFRRESIHPDRPVPAPASQRPFP